MTSNIHVITGPTIKFPLSQTFLIESNREFLLVDPGCGRSTLFTWLREHNIEFGQIDRLLISHPHSDHIAISKELVERYELHVMAHEEAIPLIESWELFKTSFVDLLPSEWEWWEKSVRELTGFQNFSPVHEALTDGQRIHVGELTLEVLYTPGHAPGHLALVCPELSTLLPFDIDLTSFPFYGSKASDLEAFISSTERLRELDVERVISSHRRPLLHDEITESFDIYLKEIELREQRISALAEKGLSFEEIVDRAPIYGKMVDDAPILRKFEREMVRMHLEKLKSG
ncbi:MAG: MBL fold metallo-hydrolase [Candidatus Hodarchaeales archaeon]|jgi:glyoxylase-like metal-dependent hydrolase (beta-lactamase superfamily II)